MAEKVSDEFCTPSSTRSDLKAIGRASTEIKIAAVNVVRKALNLACMLIEQDVKHEYFYKNPLPDKRSSEDCAECLTFSAEYIEKTVDWVSIQEFSFNAVFSQIREYISMWILSPATQFALLVHDKTQIVPLKGTRYFIDALFSKPTRRCPNPLAVAKVYFTVIVPERLPKHYPVMVMYRFEGYRTVFYAMGTNAVRSKDFQRFFIDSILYRKLAFYARLFECRHPKGSVEEEEAAEEGKEEEKSVVSGVESEAESSNRM